MFKNSKVLLHFAKPTPYFWQNHKILDVYAKMANLSCCGYLIRVFIRCIY